MNNKELIRTILYVEDNQANLRLVETIIDNLENISLLSAYNAELGIDHAISEKPDLNQPPRHERQRSPEALAGYH